VHRHFQPPVLGPQLNTRQRPPHTTRLFCLLLLLLSVVLYATAAAEPVLQGEVTWIYDGDTLRVAGIGKVRLIGIDTPEKEASPRDDFYQQWQIPPAHLRTIAHKSLAFCIAEAKGKTVNLTLDATPRDRHGRLLAYVHLPDGRLLNRLLLEKGLATVYRKFDFRRKQDFLQAEQEARSKRWGLWQGP
jgi:micrococcal nuclease